MSREDSMLTADELRFLRLKRRRRLLSAAAFRRHSVFVRSGDFPRKHDQLQVWFVDRVDTVTRVAGSASFKIPKSTLLANDGTVDCTGAVNNTGVTIQSVTSGSGNSVSESGAFVFYTPADPSASAPLTFTYVAGDGTSTDTSTVTVNTAAAQPFAIQILGRTTATYNGTSTSITVEFLTSPNTSLLMEYSTGNMTVWKPYAFNPANSGSTGDFVLTFTEAGDHVAEWTTGMFFRATRQ